MKPEEISQELQPLASEMAQAADARTTAIDAGVAAAEEVPQAVENVAETTAADAETAVTDTADDVEDDVEGVAKTATASTESVCVRLLESCHHAEQNVVRHAGDILYVPVATAERWIKEGIALLHTLETKIV